MGGLQPGKPATKKRLGNLFRSRLSIKMALFFFLVSFVPLVFVSIFLVVPARVQISDAASSRLKTVATNLTKGVDYYIANDVHELLYFARIYSNGAFNDEQINKAIESLFSQNQALRQLTVLMRSGTKLTATRTSSGVKFDSVQSDQAMSETLKFLTGKGYFISPGPTELGSPQINIGLPVLKQYPKTSDGLLATASTDNPDDIIGGLVGYYDIGNLWTSILKTEDEFKGRGYLVDPTGELVSYPDKDFLAANRSLSKVEAVKNFINGKHIPDETVSELGTDVISVSKKTQIGWGIVVEEETSSMFAELNSYIRLATIVDLIFIILAIVTGILFGRSLLRPIRELSEGAHRMSAGDFTALIKVKTHDELRDLADTFNGMAKGIRRLVLDLKENNKQLKIEQIKLNNIISSVNDGVIAIDGAGKIISINPPAKALLSKDAEEPIGRHLNDVFKWVHESEAFKPDIEMGGIYHYGDISMVRDGTVLYIDVIVAVLNDSNSDISAIITVHDQTETRELNFMKLDFVAIAAHELRTPLTVVRGYLDMLLTGTAVKELSVFNLENLSKAVDGADQLRLLINKLLNIARIERGDMELFPEKLNIFKLVKENVDQHKSMAAQKQQIISFEANVDGAVYVTADTSSIIEVLNNLIGNALKYTSKEGDVKVNLVVETDRVKVKVKDNGPGIPNEMRDRLFTKFYRAERSLISGSHGTGLGLFISKTIVELQGGVIDIEPDKGDGSVFYFTLPLYDGDRDDELIAKKTSGGIHGWFKKRPRS